ncbi:MAG: very short patch repair endonuclease [Rubrivivax sp.]
MADIVSPEVRSRMMAGIRGRDTKPELMLRKGLHAAGFRYRLHVKDLPGKPDMVFPRHRAVLFAHGCFWHGHDCQLFRWPSSRQDWWREKITRNRAVDARSEAALAEAGWRLGVVWECALKGRTRLPFAEVLEACSTWLRSDAARLEVRGVA